MMTLKGVGVPSDAGEGGGVGLRSDEGSLGLICGWNEGVGSEGLGLGWPVTAPEGRRAWAEAAAETDGVGVEVLLATTGVAARTV
jgi:hypothetical protein